MPVATEPFTAFAQRMREAGLPPILIQTFEHYYQQLAEGHTGQIPEDTIEPVADLPDAETLPDALHDAGRAALKRTVMIKLNGGLGTSMGLDRAKSLLRVRGNLTFLDIIARQALHTGLPLVLMNSFNTRQDTLDALAAYPDLQNDIPLDFLQHKVPKVLKDGLRPAVWPDNPHLEWCPPGHGDLYLALQTGGLLDTLLEAGYRYAFISNSDNLGAVIDTKLLGYLSTEALPFMMEVADRTEADRKGGHLAQYPDGQLLLRESAQCPKADIKAFRDVTRHRYFNTNNLWLDLQGLHDVLQDRGGLLGLPMIRNTKPVDPRDAGSPAVYQLETAMGSAIAVFEGSGAVRVPRTRFAPVKTTSDLLAVRSDAYVLTEDMRIVLNPDRPHAGPPVISLDALYYKLIDDLEARFPPEHTPSLVNCVRLRVEGDVTFEPEITVEGTAEVQAAAPAVVKAGTRIEGTVVL